MKNSPFLLALLLFTFILVFNFCWQPGYLDDDSLSYAQTARHIANSNQWFFFDDPTWGGKFYYHFPLVIWVTAIIFKIFGVNVISASIFSLLSCLAAVIVLFYFGRALKNSWVGFFGASVFLLINFTPRLARQCRMDMPLTLFVILSLYFFLKAYKGKKINYLLFGLFNSLAILAKDVFGLAPLFIAIIFLAVLGKIKELINHYFLSAIILSFVPVIAWMGLEFSLYRQTTFYYWFHHNFIHLLQSKSFYTPVYYYPLEIFKRFFYFFPLFIYGAYLAIQKFLKKEEDGFILILIWAIFIPLAFSFGRQKLHYFIYSMYPAFALLSGLAVYSLLKDKQRVICFYCLVIIITTFGLLQLFFPIKISKQFFIETIRLCPEIDNILANSSNYEFYTLNQDDNALVFYSKKINSTIRAKDNLDLTAKLNQQNSKQNRFCLLNKNDFGLVAPLLKDAWSIILRYKDKVLIVN